MGAVLLMVSSSTFAGGLLTNTNQNIAFLRNPARDGAIGIDGVYSNPAGVAWLNAGFHLSLNIQSAYQTRKVTSTFAPFASGVGNNGSSTKRFKGEAKAPVIPSFQAAYNTKRWSFSAGFAITGGGGKCTFDDGLASFESQAALLPLVGAKLGVNAYGLNSYMKGKQYYYGLQIGAGYKITNHLSAFVGGRIMYANCNYYGYVKDIQINMPGTAQMVPASGLFQQLYEQAVGQGNNAAAHQYGALMEATKDVTLNCDQTGWGFTPIIGLDYKHGKWNIGAKYEFKTRMRLENRAANSESAANLSALDNYRDGKTVAADIPAILTVGVQYEVLPSLRVNLGYHHYFDKQATQEGHTEDLLEHNSNEYLVGAEYDINKHLQVSAGAQWTRYGMSDDYMKDISFNVSSYSLGLGLGYRFNKTVKVNLAYFQTIYEDYTKNSNDYNNVSHVVGVAAGEQVAQGLVAAGALKGTDRFSRTNKVFGIGVDLTF